MSDASFQSAGCTQPCSDDDRNRRLKKHVLSVRLSFTGSSDQIVGLNEMSEGAVLAHVKCHEQVVPHYGQVDGRIRLEETKKHGRVSWSRLEISFHR